MFKVDSQTHQIFPPSFGFLPLFPDTTSQAVTHPNPFNTATTIGFSLPASTITASVYVYNMNGVQLKSYPIDQRGKGNITIQGSEFREGMFLYALIADGKVIDTKRMILTK